jgi:hypothetical protein
MEFLIFLALLCTAAAMPMPYWINETTICSHGHCDKPNMTYERVADIQPGYQWNDAGGYCGAWATQRAVLAKGAWISQQQVRDHTRNCGGHDSEILSCNIDEAWTNLKIDYEAFAYGSEPIPQTEAFAVWLKKQLSEGHVVAWMIMWNGQNYPIYDLKPPAGMYGHIEPVIGIQSNHPLNDSTVYDDDVVLHFTDGGTSTVHRTISSLPCKWGGLGQRADCGQYEYGVGNPYGFGWAAKGFAQDSKPYVPASLKIQPYLFEPDTRSGKKPEELQGTLTATELTIGAAYDIYRWDSVEEAFTYSQQYKIATFTSSSSAYVHTDVKTFSSGGTTYYRVVKM